MTSFLKSLEYLLLAKGMNTTVQKILTSPELMNTDVCQMCLQVEVAGSPYCATKTQKTGKKYVSI